MRNLCINFDKLNNDLDKDLYMCIQEVEMTEKGMRFVPFSYMYSGYLMRNIYEAISGVFDNERIEYVK